MTVAECLKNTKRTRSGCLIWKGSTLSEEQRLLMGRKISEGKLRRDKNV